MPDWIDFCRDALKCKWFPQTILNRLSPALFDIYGGDFRDEIIRRLERIMQCE